MIGVGIFPFARNLFSKGARYFSINASSIFVTNCFHRVLHLAELRSTATTKKKNYEFREFRQQSWKWTGRFK